MPEIDIPEGPENPLLAYLGIQLAEVDAGRAVFEMELAPQHLNRQGSLQGGVVATLLDVACGYAGLGVGPGEVAGNAATVMLTISYLSKVTGGRVRAVGRVTRSGRSIYFSNGELLAPDGTLVATAQGSFKRARE